MILAGDIGGTKTDLAVISPETGPRNPVVQATFPSADFAALDGIVRKFREKHVQPAETRGYQPASERSIEQSRKVAAGEKLRS